ncbi:MAG: peptide chain release factor N(5)-glutamine methyltransferase [Patescibacteria group bacterium]|nr:peptide chain release factor N(5)-glutamine methyltransferase [Patescibacteria group bacterium]
MLNLKQIRAKKSAGVAIPDFDILLATAIGQPREYLYAHPEFTPGLWPRIKLAYFLRRFRRGWPIAYVTERKEFFGLNFLVNKHTLIPRPETESMVEEATKEIRKQKKGNSILFIDVGTGSGCVPVAIAKTLGQENTTMIATDISSGALRVARKNAKRHNVKIDFRRGDLLKPVRSLFLTPYSLVIITANLPYLTTTQFQSEPTIQREPKTALIADDKDGLSLYEKLFQQITTLTELGTANYELIIEIDPRQATAALALAKKYFPEANIEIKKDLAGRDRLVEISSSAK